MDARKTEMRHPRAEGFDTLPAHEALRVLARAQVDAAAAAEAAVPEIARAAEVAARALAGGGRLVYAAAGSSGLMALADALELPGTYGISRDRIVVLLAGGTEALMAMTGSPEDDDAAAEAEVRRLGVGPADALIAVTASGSTPYPLAAAKAAAAAGAKTIGVANNRGAPLLEQVDVGICLETPPEVVAGSTRMGAGTAQKIALNMLSTMMAVHLGHVHDGYMVNLVADNIKLRDRARRMVMEIASVSEAEAENALVRTNGAVKAAVLAARGVETPEALLGASGDRLRVALASMTEGGAR
ncbi:N-acetylmuramic acid 6-phosphate etherase [Devosia albogilva]|uniref:N-acetylmuramic acid 6-phosphate etherase n=1 Tax=Devosia albogilva TaxID=429726 RepID=A0ABW5QNH4_9HYPH